MEMETKIKELEDKLANTIKELHETKEHLNNYTMKNKKYYEKK